MNIKGGTTGLACALSVAWILGAGATPARAVLVLYDDFSNSSVSSTRWTRDTAGAGTVTFGSGHATISMNSPTTGKHARMVEPSVLRFTGENDLFEISWDQQITVNNVNGFLNGLALVTSDGLWYFGGQLGRENDNPEFTPHYLFEDTMYETVLGAAPRANLKYHFDAEITPATQWLRVYLYNPAWDAQPLRYRTSGLLVDSMRATRLMPVEQNLTVMFAAELYMGDDPYAQARNVITVDNVFQGFTPIPEPASAGLTAWAVLAAAQALTRRARRQSR